VSWGAIKVFSIRLHRSWPPNDHSRHHSEPLTHIAATLPPKPACYCWWQPESLRARVTKNHNPRTEVIVIELLIKSVRISWHQTRNTFRQNEIHHPWEKQLDDFPPSSTPVGQGDSKTFFFAQRRHNHHNFVGVQLQSPHHFCHRSNKRTGSGWGRRRRRRLGFSPFQR
jgi:hypothetical protein